MKPQSATLATPPSVQKRVTALVDTVVDGSAEIITVEELEEKIRNSIIKNSPLRIKQGIDPTSPDVHIGHMVPYRKMRQFQDAGHTGVLIIGDFTAQIGDPTDRTSERTRLSHEETSKNAKNYTKQIFRMVREDKAEVHHQSSWFSRFDLNRIFDLAGKFSVAQLLAHETFRDRLQPGKRLSLHELFYPLLQAYDSVEIRADVELGATDQKFNILCGRDLMRSCGMKPQVAVLVPLLSGNDERKMSKTAGNHIPVGSTATEKVGKVMSIPDTLLREYMILAAGMPSSDVEERMDALDSGSLHPRDLKLEVAESVAAVYHGCDEARRGVEVFISTFSKGDAPSDMPTVRITGSMAIIEFMKSQGLAASSSEARRLIEQGGVSIDGTRVGNINARIDPGNGESVVLKVGKRKFLRIAGGYAGGDSNN